MTLMSASRQELPILELRFCRTNRPRSCKAQRGSLRTACLHLSTTDNMMKQRLEIACRQIQCRQGDRQVETAWPSTSRIEIEHPTPGLNQRAMRMAGNNHVDPTRRWIELQVVDVMKDIDRVVAKPDRLCIRIIVRPRPIIDIPPNCDDRRNPAESVDDLGAADVTGMDDVGHAGQPLLGFGTQESVCIRDNSDSTHDGLSWSSERPFEDLGMTSACEYGRVLTDAP